MEMNISARDIRAFLAVSKTRSFSVAARQMHLSQSALSTLIARIESMVGTRLFERTTRLVELTAAGEVLAAQAEQLLADIERALGNVRDVAMVRKGSVAVAALPSLAARIVPQLFRTFSEKHPDIKLSLIDTLSEPAFELVRDGRVDFALTAANPAYNDLDYVPLTTDSFVLLIPEGHALARARKLSFTKTLSYPHVSMSRSTSVRQYVNAAALQHGIQFQPAYEVDHLATIGAMVAAGLGVSALPEMAAEVIADEGLLRRPLVEPVIRRSIGLVKRKESGMTPAAEAMVALLQRQIRK